ncbi:MAG: alpha/beta hydrolase [Chitinispirillaceae bacterium]
MIKKIASERYGKIVETRFGRFFVRIVGEGEPAVWIEPSLGGLSAEWWSIQDILAEYTTVITYDRLGYGWSSQPMNRRRTPSNIADEIAELIETLGIGNPLVFIGHSQGGLYIRAFLKEKKQRVAGILLLDPLSPFDKDAKEKLEPDVFRKSGFDKTRQMLSMKLLAQFGLVPLLKSLILKSPPFYYYTSVSDEEKEIIFQSIRKRSFYSTIIEEYRESHKVANVLGMGKMKEFFSGPIAVLCHDTEVIKKEIIEYGGLTESDAQLVDDVWKDLIREYCELSSKSEFIQVEHASHYIHMSNPDVVVSKCKDFLKNAIPGN